MNLGFAKAAARGALDRLGYRLVRRQRLDDSTAEIAAAEIASSNPIDILQLVINDHVRDGHNPFFVQIGANDGLRDDDMRAYILGHSWEGVLVEPQPGPFARLVENYRGHPGLRFENAAIGKSPGVLPLYGFSGTLGDTQLDVFTSFDYDRIANIKKYMNIQYDIERFDVPTMTFRDLLSKYSIDHLDILVIDAEGYDFEILKTIDFAAVRPAIIQFEQANLTPADKVACYEMLVAEGYRLGRRHRDIIAYRAGR